MKLFDKLYIDGQWVNSHANKLLDVINPATETLAGQAALADEVDVDRAVSAAKNAFNAWSQLTSAERANYISQLAGALEKRIDDLTDTITAEMGAPLGFCREVQVEDPIDALAKHADRAALLDQTLAIGNAQVVREPVGVCAFINPWNYPLHQMIGKIAPALAAGCTMVVKPSENTPLHAFILAEAVHEVGLPAGVFNLLNGTGAEVGAPLCQHPDVDMVSFTGSTRAGIAISKAAAPTIKRVCLELGGKSPLLIREDADLQAAVTFGVDDVMINSGQTCTALTRMLVPQSRYQEALSIAKEYAESLSVGDPTDADTFLGPLASREQLDIVQRYIRTGIAEGAKLLTGGLEKINHLETGYYLRPTIFSDVHNKMTIAQEEIFGPVLCMIPYQDEDHALEIANDTPYGLSARVWSGDSAKAEQLAKKIRAGQVYINNGDWNNEAPFGGYKQSGNGRELGNFGVEEFFETKAIIR